MASFTDQISKFNPYVAQLPVDAMVKVGMYKQAQYDAGVQKIQSYMDNIAGMDIYNEGDKEYVQSKLNELGNNLKSVAAGDFSNQQLVNSVGGMATQIAKDPLVLNAVANTAAFKKTVARIEKDQADGKSGANNIQDFYDQAKPWMESKKPGAKFQANYSQYRDVNKTAMEAIKALHPMLRSIDIPFEVVDGRINTEKIADAMKRNKIEGVTEGQIETALRAALTSEDYNQLAIDGRVTFRDVSPDKLNAIVANDLRTVKEINGNEIGKLMAQLPAQVQDPTKTSEINDRIEFYKKQGYIMRNDKGELEDVTGTLDDQAKEDYQLVKDNPNKVKESIYRQGFFRQWGNAFKWSSEDYRYEDNPFKKVEQWNADMELKWATENRLKTESERDYALKLKEDARKDKELQLKLEEAYGSPGMPIEEGNATDNVLKAEERINAQIKSVNDGVLDKRKQLIGKGYTDAQINNMVADYQKNGNKANIPATEIGIIQDILKDTQYSSDLVKLRDDTRAEVNAEIDNEAGTKKLEAQRKLDLSSFDNSAKTEIISNSNAKISLTARNLADAYENGRISLAQDVAPLGQLTLVLTDDNGTKHVFQANKVGATKNAWLRTLVPKLSNYASTYQKADKDLNARREQAFKERLAPRVAELVPTITAIGFGKDKTVPTNIANNLSAFITAASSKAIAADDKFKVATASKYLSGDELKNTRVLLRQNGSTYQAVIKSETDPENLQVINLSEKQAIDIFGEKYVDTNKREALRVRAGRGSNNINGGPDRAPIQTQFGDFPNIKHYQLTAQLDEDSKYKGQFVPKIHVLKADGTYQTFEIAGKNRAQRLGYNQGKAQLSNLTDDTMIKLLKELYPKYDFSQLYYK